MRHILADFGQGDRQESAALAEEVLNIVIVPYIIFVVQIVFIGKQIDK